MAQLTGDFTTKPVVGDATKQTFASTLINNDSLNRYKTMTNGDAGSHMVTECVYISAANTVKKADSDAAGTADGIAFAIATVLTTAEGLYQFHGVLGGFTGLVADTKYYVSATAGAITSTKPASNPCFVGIAISTTELLIMPRGVLSIATGELADDAVTLAKLAHGTANKFIGFDSGGVPVEKSGGVAANGTYSGDGATSNKQIAHGLGSAPKLVVINSTFTSVGDGDGPLIAIINGTVGNIYAVGRTSSHAADDLSVTAADATNFCVGNSADWSLSANYNGNGYKWFAIT